jgi:hypothetical protein
MRGAGGSGTTGFATTGGAGGAPAEATGAAGEDMVATGGAVGRAGAIIVEDAGGAATTGGVTTGRAVTSGAADEDGGGGVATGAFTTGGATVVGWLTAAGGAAAGFSTGAGATGACVTGAGTARGATGVATASLRCVIAFSTSPGREMCDKSILVFISSSPRAERTPDLPAEDPPSAAERMYTRTFSASCSSRELECVFFSVTPTNGSVSRIALLFTSSSRARSLIRTLLIRPFVSPCCKLGHHSTSRSQFLRFHAVELMPACHDYSLDSEADSASGAGCSTCSSFSFGAAVCELAASSAGVSAAAVSSVGAAAALPSSSA